MQKTIRAQLINSVKDKDLQLTDDQRKNEFVYCCGSRPSDFEKTGEGKIKFIKNDLCCSCCSCGEGKPLEMEGADSASIVPVDNVQNGAGKED